MLMKIQVIGDVTACGWVNSFLKFKVTAFLLLRQVGQDAVIQNVTNILKSSCQLKTLGARPSTIAVVDIVCVCVCVYKPQGIHAH